VNLNLVRAYISRLPFTTRSVDAVHAGAASHYCPSPSTADVRVDSNVDTTVDILSCPICYKPLIKKGTSGLNMSSVSRSGF
jgi:hypothetical protein